jgi:hypothetical protein
VRMGKKLQNLEVQPYKKLVAKYESKDELGRPRLRWEDIIENGLYEIECEVVGWIRLTQYMAHCDGLTCTH